MLRLYIGNKNYSSWSMRPWVLMQQAGIPFQEHMVRFDSFDADSNFKKSLKGVNPVGDVAALQIEGVTVIVNSKRSQCHSRDCFTKLGVDPSTKKIVVVKSMQHFHAAYAPIASEVVYVAAPGALVPDWSLLPYRKADKGQWPFVANPHA